MVVHSATHIRTATSQVGLKEAPKQKLHPSWFFGIIAGSALLLFYQLGIRTLDNWDEAIYAQISREIVTSNDWLTLRWGGNDWFHKPPLFMWLTAIAYKLFGVSEFSARVVSAAAGVGVVGCTYLIGRWLYGQVVALLAAVVLLTNFAFVFHARFGTTDITLTLFIFIGVYAYLRASQQGEASKISGINCPLYPSDYQSVPHPEIWWYLFWAASALAFMTKGFAGLILPITVCLTLLINRQLTKTLQLKSFWLGIGLALLIALPWHIVAIYQHGQAFIDEYILYHVVERATGELTEIEGHQAGPSFYFLKLAKNFFPWVWLLPMAFALQIKDAIAHNSNPTAGSSAQSSRVLLVLVGVVLGGFTLAGTKLSWYIVPCYPALAVWVGYFIRAASQTASHSVQPNGDADVTDSAKLYTATFFSFIAAVAVICVLTPQRVVFLSPMAQSSVAAVGVIGLLLMIAFLRQMIKSKARSKQTVVLMLCGALTLSGLREIRGLYLAVNDPVPALAKQASQRIIGSQKNPADLQPLIVISLSEKLFIPTAMFYSDRSVYWVRAIDELEAVAVGDAIMAKADLKQLNPLYNIQVLSEAQKLVYATFTRR